MRPSRTFSGNITGVHRTWLARDGSGKAPVADPRRAMGELLGNAVRFDAVKDVLAAGEGIETMLSLKSLSPQMPMVAALSATHLAALLLPQSLRRLYVAVDNDPAGRRAATRLAKRARSADVESLLFVPHRDDWNTDFHELGPHQVFAGLGVQLTNEDAARLAGGSTFKT